MRESTIEAKVCRYARSKGWLVYKFVSPSNRGVPDRMFIKCGIIFFVEFKAPGKQANKLQYKVINRIRSNYFDVYVVDNVEEGQKIVDKYAK